MSDRGQALALTADVTVAITAVLPGFPPTAVATDIMSSWFRVNGTFPLAGAKVHITAKGAPGTSALVYDLFRSTDAGATFVTVLPSGVGNKLGLPTANHDADLSPSWQVTKLNDGDLLRLDLAQADDGSAHDVAITIVPS